MKALKKHFIRKPKIKEEHFRVAIFGSARIKKNDPRYKLVERLAKLLAQRNIDVVTGGGPGLMDAASRGHHQGRKSKGSQATAHSIGLTIKLPMEQRNGYHLDIKKDFGKFSNRLDSFMELSDVVVVAPGGIGTLLELLYTWQLVQVHHICEMPIILLGSHWQGLLDWIKKEMANKKLMNKEDFNFVFIAKNCSQAIDLIDKYYADKQIQPHACKNFDLYKKHLKR